MSSSVALARWSWRLTRREWRQHLLVTALVATALMLVTLGALAINNITREDPDYGSATHLVKVATDGRSLDSATSAALESFGPVAVSAWRTPQTVAGESGSVELSDMGLKSTLGGTNLTLIEGKMPDAEGQIAITSRLQLALAVQLNQTIDFAGMKVKTVVGIIEDPNDLTRRLGILGPGTITDPSYVDVALQMSDVEFSALKTSLGDQLLGSTAIEPGGSRVASFFLIALLSGVAMVELGLLCSAGFAVLARRRLRQFGMLSALGASERNLRVTMTVTGVMVGSIGATMGVTVGYAASRALQGRFESWLGWRFRTWGLPVKIVLPLMVLAITTAGVSAWWPSRSVSRLSIVNLLAARRPAGRPATRSALFGVAIALGGAALLNWGVATRTVLAAFVGLLLSLGGVLLLAPTFVRHIGRLSAHLPLSGRIAGRDLARHQTRSASALAAIVLALGIPLGFVLSSSSAEARLSNETPNLPANLALVFQRDTGGRNESPPQSFDEASVSESLKALARTVPGSQLVAIQLAYDPTAERITTTYPTGVVDESFDSLRIQVPMGENQTPTWADAVWVATPELLRAWKLDPGLARSEAELLGPPRPDLHLGISQDVTPALVESTAFDFPAHRSAAPYWIPQRAVVEGGLATVTAGWVLESLSPISADQRTQIREANAGSFWIDLPDPPGSEDLHSVRLVASLIAYAAGLAVLAMTVGLVRSEAQDADRTLTAVGAPARTQRWIAGATAGLLSFAGSILAVPIGLLFLVAMTSNPSGKNTFTVPWRNLTVIPVGLPLIATIGAFLLTSTRSSYERRPHR